MIKRHTVVLANRLAMRGHRLQAAREASQGCQIMTIEQLAARLAGGFCSPIDSDVLRTILRDVIPTAELTELGAIRDLPGLVAASADTLSKAWAANIELRSLASNHPRLSDLAVLEKAVLDRLPAAMMRPVDLLQRASARFHLAKAILGPVDVRGLSDLAPCWRPFLLALAKHVPVTWSAGPRPVPAWIIDTQIAPIVDAKTEPTISSVSCATALHEAIEALRWARELIASGTARAEDIAIATTRVASYDHHFLALRADANLHLHFAHGVPVTASRDGQAAAALADILVRGPTAARIRRAAALLPEGELAAFPEGWLSLLPYDSPLISRGSWQRLLGGLKAEDWPGGVDCTSKLRALIDLFLRGTEAAVEAGDRLLRGRSKAIWSKALATANAAAIDTTIDLLRQDDSCEAMTSIIWTPAHSLAAAPRPFVRLLGLTSAAWPRRSGEDRLLPGHILAPEILEPIRVAAADRAAFDAILATTQDRVTISRPRRDEEGRLVGRSPLLRGRTEDYLRRNRTPPHAVSEADRLLARPTEFAGAIQATAATACWGNWQRADLSAHDGVVRPSHPVLQHILQRTQSASSLTRLLRNPLGFAWQYGLTVAVPEDAEEPLALDSRDFGTLLHDVLERAVSDLEKGRGLASLDDAALKSAIDDAANEVAKDWEAYANIPPLVIWRCTLSDVTKLATVALAPNGPPLDRQRSYVEVRFGGRAGDVDNATPWDTERDVFIPGTTIRINGFIDRLDLAADFSKARVFDYKSGRRLRPDVVLNGGKELQRCLYAAAVQALLGPEVEVEASLIFPGDAFVMPLDDAASALADLTRFVSSSSEALASGLAVAGPDAGGDYDDLAFALPANSAKSYSKRKMPAIKAALGDAAHVWEAA